MIDRKWRICTEILMACFKSYCDHWNILLDPKNKCYDTIFSSVADVISQFVMLYMMLSLSLGWTLAVAYKYHHSTLVQLKEKPAAKIVAIIGILQVSINCILLHWRQLLT